MKPIKVLIVLLVAASVLTMGCTHNLTTLKPGEVYQRTGTANLATLNAEGDMEASNQELGQTLGMLDPNGIWMNTPGPGMHLSAQLPQMGVVQLFSPKDVTADKLDFKFSPDTQAMTLSVTGFKANMSDPMAQEVAAAAIKIPALKGMTEAEALATVRKWEEAGEMAPTVAELIKSIIAAIFPAATVVP